MILKNRYVICWALALAFILYLLNFLAFVYSWYWRFDWYDLMMHFLGGVLIGILTWLVIAFIRKDGVNLPRRNLLAYLVFGALLVGGIWELFELSVDVYWSTAINLKSTWILQEGGRDTFTDLLMDGLGGAFAFVMFQVFSKKTINNDNQIFNDVS